MIPITNIRRLHDLLILIIGIPTPEQTDYFYWEGTQVDLPVSFSIASMLLEQLLVCSQSADEVTMKKHESLK